MAVSDELLRQLVHAILTGDASVVSNLLMTSPPLAVSAFEDGATRQSATDWYVTSIGRYIYAGDTGLHLAAAAYRSATISMLLAAGANVHARNRHGDQPIHSAAVGAPGSPSWNPSAQAETLTGLVQAGADPNSINKLGVTPLHRAVRTRCAAAVRTLLELGADPRRTNKSGSTAISLAKLNTGRGGTGSPEAKSEQQEIIRLLEQHSGKPPDW